MASQKERIVLQASIFPGSASWFQGGSQDIDLYTSENFILASPVAGGDSSFGNGVFSGEPFVKLPGALGKHRWRTALQLFAEMPGGIGVVELAFFQHKK